MSDRIALLNLPSFFNDLHLDRLGEAERALIFQIDACLPQTQCGLCGHAEGCLPYATAIVTQKEPYNQCIPGGQPVSDQIATILQAYFKQNLSRNGQDFADYFADDFAKNLVALPSKWPIDSTTQRPTEVRALIEESACIGCTKCIPACPVDAIIGTGKHMHTVITDLCTGCELCVPACPVDCIKLEPTHRVIPESQRQNEQDHLRQRYYVHLMRMMQQMQDNTNSQPVVSMMQAKANNATITPQQSPDEKTAKATIEMAKIRSKIKKLEKQLQARPNPQQEQDLITLKAELQALMA